MKRIAIFASGAGSNAEKIVEYLASASPPAPLLTERGVGMRHSVERSVGVRLIVSNKPDGGVLKIANSNNIPTLIIEKEKFYRGNAYVDELKNAGIDFIVLAGFLWKLPSLLIKAYPGKIINIHPALLPKYGGKGMYGHFVHEAVLAAKEKESGITIHYVDEHYDNGDIIFQAKCPVYETDSPISLAERVRKLEHAYYAKVVEEVVAGS